MDHVGLVLDKEYGEKLSDLAAQMPVWIIDTPTNRPVVESYWKTYPSNSSRQDGVTIFTEGCCDDYIDECLGRLQEIVLHHGESKEAPCIIVDIIGIEITEGLVEGFYQLNFSSPTDTATGFCISGRCEPRQ